MVFRVLICLLLSALTAPLALADDLTGLWECRMDTSRISGQINHLFQSDGTLRADMKMQSPDDAREKMEFSISMLWQYQYKGGILTTVPLEADKAEALIEGKKAPKFAEQMKAFMLATKSTQQSVVFQSKQRMTLTDDGDVIYCQRAARCGNLACLQGSS